MRSDYINNDTVSHILWSLSYANKLICEIALETGWRIDDILNLKTNEIENALKKKRPCITIIEQKTGKKSRKYISKDLLYRVLKQSGIIYAFQGRDDYRKHRSRQAVYLDLKKAAKHFKIKVNLSPHSLRKNYAVYLKDTGHNIAEIQKALNHDNILTTMLYAMSDELAEMHK